MKDKKKSGSAPESREPANTARLRLPGFISEDEVGLGDVIKRASFYLGLQPCGGCDTRAEALNRWISFPGRRR